MLFGRDEVSFWKNNTTIFHVNTKGRRMKLAAVFEFGCVKLSTTCFVQTLVSLLKQCKRWEVHFELTASLIAKFNSCRVNNLRDSAHYKFLKIMDVVPEEGDVRRVGVLLRFSSGCRGRGAGNTNLTAATLASLSPLMVRLSQAPGALLCVMALLPSFFPLPSVWRWCWCWCWCWCWR